MDYLERKFQNAIQSATNYAQSSSRADEPTNEFHAASSYNHGSPASPFRCPDECGAEGAVEIQSMDAYQQRRDSVKIARVSLVGRSTASTIRSGDNGGRPNSIGHYSRSVGEPGGSSGPPSPYVLCAMPTDEWVVEPPYEITPGPSSSSNNGMEYSAGGNVPKRLRKQIKNAFTASENLEDNDNKTKAMTSQIKAKLNNARYDWFGFKPATKFNEESPIWLLGKLYHSRNLLANHFDSGQEGIDAEHERFMQDFMSRIWFTYRTGFPNLNKSKLMSDTGWGCMLRSGQMMIAQGLMLHRLGRDWSQFEQQTPDTIKAHREIVSFFGDSPACPLSIHTLVQFGMEHHDKALGDWYGPATTGQIFREIFQSQIVAKHPELDQIRVYCGRDCAVFLDEIDELCTGMKINRPYLWPTGQASLQEFPPIQQQHQSSNGGHLVEAYCMSGPRSMASFEYVSQGQHQHQKGLGQEDRYGLHPSGSKTPSNTPQMAHRSHQQSNANKNELSPDTDDTEEAEVLSILNAPSIDAVNQCREPMPEFLTAEYRQKLKTKPWTKALILIVPLRLGTDRLNGAYANHIQTLLSLRNCIGLVGGKPKHSMYFMGSHGQSLIYLDPHKAQKYEDLTVPQFSIASFHCRAPRKLDIKDMDPSCAVGFYARTREEFKQLLQDMSTLIDYKGNTRRGGRTGGDQNALFTVVDSELDFLSKNRRSSATLDAKLDALQHGFELL